jgi:hypothetical protein
MKIPTYDEAVIGEQSSALERFIILETPQFHEETFRKFLQLAVDEVYRAGYEAAREQARRVIVGAITPTTNDKLRDKAIREMEPETE